MSDATEFWKGEFGKKYLARNMGRVESNIAFFEKFLPERFKTGSTHRLKSVVEFGCGAGENLLALSKVIKAVSLYGVEVNEDAADACKVGTITRGSFLTKPVFQRDLCLSKGLLIHIPPHDLPLAYKRIYESARRVIMLAEYHNPAPVEVEYRGHRGKLWKRDFAAELWAAYPDLKLESYGFAWKHDKTGPQDDLVVTIFTKKGGK
jgi:pseudaminic acid biosynthesis-associated methylase